MNQKKLLIGIPTSGHIEPEVFKAIYELNTSMFYRTDFNFTLGYCVDRARNELAKKAIEGKYDYILMIDSDVVVPRDTLEIFFKQNPPDVLLGIYPRKGQKRKAEIFSFNADSYSAANQFGFNELEQLRDFHHAVRVRVKAGGLGCALIKTSVFEKLEYPYFRYVLYPDGNVLSEDLYFCNNVRDHGGEISASTEVWCGHIKKYTIYE